MKKRILYILILAAMTAGCRKTENLPDTSQLNTEPAQMNDFDAWVLDSLTNPYNINVRYRWNEANMSDLGRYNFPAKVESVDILMRVMKHTWIDSYVNTADREFIKHNSPREFTIFGGEDRTSNGGPGAWGQAAGGVNVLLFQSQGVNESMFADAAQKKSYSGLIHHEFTHILNQNTPFDEGTFMNITPEGYMAQWQTVSARESRMDGFISSYARMNIMEDFAEMVSTLVTHTAAEWNAIINQDYNFFSNSLNMALGTVGEVTVEIARDERTIHALDSMMSAFADASFPPLIASEQSQLLQEYHLMLAAFFDTFSEQAQDLYFNSLAEQDRETIIQILNGTEIFFRPELFMQIVTIMQSKTEAVLTANQARINQQRSALDQIYANVQRAKEGRDKILEKERFIADYFEKQLEINLYTLRDNVLHQINSPVLRSGVSSLAALTQQTQQSAQAGSADGGLVSHHAVSRARLMDAVQACSQYNGASFAW